MFVHDDLSVRKRVYSTTSTLILPCLCRRIDLP
jgi:hypothetical protein